MEPNASVDHGSRGVENIGRAWAKCSEMLLVSSLSSRLQSTYIAELLASESLSRMGQAALVSAFVLALPFAFVYFTTWRSFMAQSSNQTYGRLPPTVPYTLPYVGSALYFGLNPSKCLATARRTVGAQAAFGLKVMGDTVYFLHGPENVARILKYKSTITTPNFQALCLVNVLGTSAKAANMYNLDESGIHPKPHPDSHVTPHNRIDHLSHASFNKLMNGDGLSILYLRWSESFARRLDSLGIGDEWRDFGDLVDFWMTPLTAALNEGIAGPLLERVNSNFTRDILKFLPLIPSLIKGLPACCLSGASSLRASLIRDVKQWHATARARSGDFEIDGGGVSYAWWGSARTRERQETLLGVDNWDHDAVASFDIGLLFGANINVHTAAIWTIIEIFKDENLLSRVRAELETIGLTAITSSQDIDKILSLPLLQSIYAEVLRLRVEGFSAFSSDREDIRINEWRFPKRSVLLVPTGAAHMDPNFWNTRDGRYPLNTFWADRFLAYSNDPQSGPQRKAATANGSNKQDQPQNFKDCGEPKFISTGIADSFMPYGVGERICPGRFFARREIVAFCANVVNDFDIKLLTDKKHFKSSSLYDGFGIQPPLEKIPFRIRRRSKC